MLLLLYHYLLETVELLQAILAYVYEVILFVDIQLYKTSLIFYLKVQLNSRESLSEIDLLGSQNVWHMLQGHFELIGIYPPS